jgi:hypothetical protein
MEGKHFYSAVTVCAPNDPSRSSCVRSGMAWSDQTRNTMIGIGNYSNQYTLWARLTLICSEKDKHHGCRQSRSCLFIDAMASTAVACHWLVASR